jgi:hypothetical protein
LIAACGASSSKSGFEDPDGGGSSSGGTSSGQPGDGGSSFNDDVVQQTPEPIAEVYGHSAGTLYKLDPNTKAVTVVGDFNGCSSVIDIALDENSKLFGTTSDALWAIDKTSAKCTQIGTGSFPNSLSFVPKGTVDPNVEALVGYEDSDYVRIDPQTGKKTVIGSIGSGYSSSGDIVSVKNGPTYLTVKGNNCDDCVLEVDPATGAMKKNWGSIKHADVFGLAFWAGSIYGFDNGGELFEVKVSGSTLTTTPIAIPGQPQGLSFWGAGSTTSAPVVPTK